MKTPAPGIHPSRRLRTLLFAIATAFAPAARAEPIILDDIQIFDGGLFIDADVEIVNGRVVVKNASESESPKPAVPDPAGPHVLELTDGSQIHGTLVSLGRSEIVWNRADATAPLRFDPAEVKRLSLAPSPQSAPEKGGATLKLDGSGWLAGDLRELRDGKFALGIGEGAVIEVDRDSVEWLSLSPSSAPPDAYDGPVGPMGFSGWSADRGSISGWDYADGSLVAKTSAPISRRFPVMPVKADIEFTAGDGGSSNRGFTLWIRPGTTTARGYSEGSFYMRFQATTVNANFYSGGEIKNFSANIPADDDAKTLTRYRLLMDRKGGRLIVHANGRQIADWDLPESEKCPPSAGMSWQPSYISSNMAWTLSNVRVRPWDGNTTPDASGDEAGKDLIQSGSDARVAGNLDGLSADSVTFGGAQISRERPIFLRLARKEAQEEPSGPIAQISLVSRGLFDVTGIGFKDGQLRVRTSFGGDLALPVAAVHAVEFPHKAGPADKAKREGADLLIFKNGDELHGRLIAGGRDQAMQWRPLKGEDSIRFEQTHVAGIVIAPGAKKEGEIGAARREGVAVRFHNGDWLPGRLLSIDEQHVLLKSAFSEEMRIKRSNVQTLYFGSDGEAPVWDGASGANEWRAGTAVPGYGGRKSSAAGDDARDPWRYLDGAFSLNSTTSSGSSNSGPNIGRVLAGLPKKVDVSFEISSSDGPASYAMQLFFDENKPGYMIQGGWDSAYLYDMSPRQQGGAFFNQPQQLDFGEKVGSEGSRRRFRFLADRPSGQMWMYVNGELVGTIGRRNTSQPANPKTGHGIAIFPRAMRSQVTISNIWIAPWSGVLPGAAQHENHPPLAVPDETPDANTEPGKTAAPTPPPQDTVALANGDETLGRLISADSGSLKLLCEVGELDIPLARALLVDLAGNAALPSKGVRFRFADKGAMTVDSFVVENGNVACKSQVAGEMRFPLSAVSEIIWASMPSTPAGKETESDSGEDSGAMFQIDGIPGL